LGKIDPFLQADVQAKLAGDGELDTEFLVQMAIQADLSAAAGIVDKTAKGAFVYEQLTAVAQQTQAPLLAQLAEMGVDQVRPYWITNMVWVRGDWNIITALAQRSDVAYLYANPQVALDVLPAQPEVGFSGTAVDAVSAVPWNISHIGADLAWAAGFSGQGVVIGGQDTGYDWDHPALIHQYRGWDGSTADHTYSWHDAIHTSNSICPGDSPEPCDDFGSGHGTHTMGTMVGNDLAPTADGWPSAAANAVGVAPGARWIGCRNMNLGYGTPASYTECYEWFVAPYPPGGDPMTEGVPSMAPHVINNSWGCPPSEGCETDMPDILEAVVNNVRAAGIVTVHSAGNSGFGCGTVRDPAATYPASFAVGATDSNDNIASFSSRGPSTFDGGLKPDISAPGVSISSTIRVEMGSYGLNSGTSMAAPHVAGLVALLISANPALAGDVDGIEAILRETAVPLTTSQGCGGDSSTDVPNHVFGYGRIDALNPILQQFPLKLYLPFSISE
jgi:serine protease AprX